MGLIFFVGIRPLGENSMQIIFLNGREVRVSLNEQRALQLLADNDYGMPRSAFYWGSRRYGQYLIDTFYSSKRVNPELHARRELLGIRYSSRANYWGSNTVPNDGIWYSPQSEFNPQENTQHAAAGARCQWAMSR